MTDKEDLDRPLSNGERRLAEYVDELITTALARQAHGPDEGGESADANDAAPPASRPKNGARASMREGLASLFLDTTSPPFHYLGHPEDHGPIVARAASERATSGGPQSVYFRRYRETARYLPEAAPTGLPDLDGHLGGGFGPGLHLVCGEPGAGRTTFAEAVAWEAVGTRRPVLYYALREGSLGAWERLILTLAAVLGRPAPSLNSLRTHALSEEDIEALSELDRYLEAQVLNVLTLVDCIPAHPDALGAFLDDVLARTSQAREQAKRTPLVVVDDLPRLLLLTGCRPTPQTFARLNDTAAAESIPCLITSDLWAPPERGSVAATTVLTLTPVPVGPDDAYGRVDLRVDANARTGWTGMVPLVFDRRSGLFAQAG